MKKNQKPLNVNGMNTKLTKGKNQESESFARCLKGKKTQRGQETSRFMAAQS